METLIALGIVTVLLVAAWSPWALGALVLAVWFVYWLADALNLSIARKRCFCLRGACYHGTGWL